MTEAVEKLLGVTFVDRSTVTVAKKLTNDDDVCHAAWVSNFGDKHKKRPNNWMDAEIKEWDKQTEGLINFLYGNKHMSPFEHNWMTFYIETPIFVGREFMRHRTWSYNEMSGRYTELPGRMWLIDDERPIVQSGKIGAYKFIKGTPEQYGLVYAETTLAYIQSWQSYNNMLNGGIAKEVARNVLPVGTMTQFYASANVRNIMQFLLLRNDEHALKEIRDVAEEIESQFAKAMPKTYKAFKAHDWRDVQAKMNDKDDEIKRLKAQIKELKKYPLLSTDFLTP
jgi:thymidylate synthase (FAD)